MVHGGCIELVFMGFMNPQKSLGESPSNSRPSGPPRRRSYVDILNAYLERNLRSNGGVLDGVIFAMVKYTMEDLEISLGRSSSSRDRRSEVF